MFSFLFGKKPKRPAITHRIWYNQSAQEQGICQHLQEATAEGKTAWLVAFFPATLDKWRQLLSEQSFRFYEISTLSASPSPAPVFLWSADILRQVLQKGGLPQPAPGALIFAEHYPLPEVEDTLLELWLREASDLPPVFHEALDSPLLGLFGGERLQKMMLMMGLQENEMLQHRLIDQSIAKAQARLAQKMATQAHPDTQAPSFAEWLARNGF
ncbi:MAG: hypothetical protein OHK0053_09200 [Microscillaceae bacterium]